MVKVRLCRRSPAEEADDFIMEANPNQNRQEVIVSLPLIVPNDDKIQEIKDKLVTYFRSEWGCYCEVECIRLFGGDAYCSLYRVVFNEQSGKLNFN